MQEDPEKAEALLQRLLDVKVMLDRLHDDVLATVNDVAPAKPTAMRSYTRSVFGLVEGALSGMSAFLVEGQGICGWTLTDEELQSLWDAVPNASVARPEGGRATLTERTKQVFKTGHRLFGNHCLVDFGGVDYRAFRDAITIRDSLMHPKRNADLEVTREELVKIDKGRNWFRAAAKRFFEAAAADLRSKLAERRRASSGVARSSRR